jgi:decaprenylphospho-beta-D-ribofuranose 2-oxidase
MPQLEAQIAAAPAVARPAALAGWGGGERAQVQLLRPRDEDALRDAVQTAAGGAIARGEGRSYGDAAQLTGGLVLETRRLRSWSLDAQRGILTAQAGVTIAELLRALVPDGWILPVLPGTQHVSVGGMIASDIHGKNHGIAGSIGRHVQAIGLMTASGEVRELEPGEAAFAATLGGMGLTGVIVWARIAMRRITGPLVTVDTDRAGELDEILRLLRQPGGEHRVAWLDLLAGRGRVRGVVTRADYAGDELQAAEPGRPDVAARATVPAWWPGGLPRSGVRGFNALRYHASPRRARGTLEPIGVHMFPLDRLAAWPRLYGGRGFVQYQFVVPFGAERVLEQVLGELDRHRVPPFLAVLKDFGPATPAPLSFPIPGWTLALDLPRAAHGLEPALGRCDELVAEAGGRVYLSKDSRMRAEVLETMYPRLGEWREQRAELDPDGRWRSDLGVRLGLVEPSRAVSGVAAVSDKNVDPTPRLAAASAPRLAAAPAPRPRRVLLIGGGSEIGLAIMRRLAAEGPVVPHLLGRDSGRLQSALEQLRQQGCLAGDWAELDADQVGEHPRVIAEAFRALGDVDVVVLAIGVLGGQAGLDADPDEAAEVLRVNLVGCGSLMLAALRELREQGHGSLIALSSVGAERPRAGNAVYGAAKAGFDSLAQGLSDAVAGSGVEVLVVRPGFVHTKMTAGLDPAPLATSPEAVAEACVRALGHGSATLWVPRTLRPLFSVLRHLPRPVYRRLPL